jgi:multiple sugar transport system ATP-binding protein
MVIVGNKDSGRTVLLRSLVGLEELAKGEVFIKNISIDKIDYQNDVSLGYLPALPPFLEKKTVRQNIEYVLSIRKDNEAFINEKINNAIIGAGLEFFKHKKVKELNYFDRIRLAIARLSVRSLDIVLIDDIFTRLSTMERTKIIKMLKDLIKSNSATSIIMTDSEEIADKFGYEKKYMVYGSLQDTPDFDINEAKG